VAWGYFAAGILWDECILGRGYFEAGYCRVGYSAVGVVCGGTTEGRGILWAGGSLRRGYFGVGLLWGIIVLSGVLWCGVSLSCMFMYGYPD